MPPGSPPTLQGGGPLFILLQHIGLIRGDGPDVTRRILAAIAITWVPLLILAILQGRAIGPTPRESFLLDIATYVRFLVCLPLLTIAEPIIASRLRAASLHFGAAGLVHSDDLSKYEAAKERIERLKKSGVAELCLLLVAILGTWIFYRNMYGGVMTWRRIATPDGSTFSYAGLWYNFVAVPALQFIVYRWLWRLAIWIQFLWTMSRLKLSLVATNTDRAGGLGFLGTSQVTVSMIVMAFGSIQWGEAAFKLLYEGVDIRSFEATFIAYLVLAEAVCLVPLLLFVPVLGPLRRAALLSYGILLNRHNLAFQDRWVQSTAPPNEELLGAPEISSLADLGSSYQVIREMKIVPFGLDTMISIAIITVLPILPLIPIAIPFNEILEAMVKTLF